MGMKATTLFDFARMEAFDMEHASNRRVLRSLAAQGSATEAVGKETVEHVMAEARLVSAGRREFRALLRALRG
jgi:hypothetical protein